MELEVSALPPFTGSSSIIRPYSSNQIILCPSFILKLHDKSCIYVVTNTNRNQMKILIISVQLCLRKYVVEKGASYLN